MILHRSCLRRRVALLGAIAPTLLAGVAIALSTSGCPNDPIAPTDAGPDAPVSCQLAFIGDPAKDPEMEIIVSRADGSPSQKVEDGGAVPLIVPPQGGKVIFAGVRVTNIDPCLVKLKGVLRDLASGLVQVDTRILNLEPTSDGFGKSNDGDIAAFSNVSVCPNNWSDTNIYGSEYELELKVTDRAKRFAERKIRVTPFCAEPAFKAECECECRAGYMSSQQCGDGGTGGGGTGGMGTGGTNQ
jgi:hypothetical protein